MEERNIALFTFILSLTLSFSKGELCNGFLYENSCVTECPRHMFKELYTRLCVKKCPDGSPFVLYNTCVQQCPRGYKEEGMLCILNGPRLDIQKRGIDSFCDSLNCTFPKRMCYNLQCWQSCPVHTFIINTTCVDKCPPKLPYNVNRTCVSTCPRSCPLITENTCVKTCPEEHYKLNSTCVLNCPGHMFIHNRACVTQCPVDAPYDIGSSNGNNCLAECPEYTALANKTCETHCPVERKVIFNRTCYADCPKSYPLMMLVDSPYSRVVLCMSECPPERVLDRKTCAKTCSSDQKLFNSTCLEQCPPSAPYIINAFDKEVYDGRAESFCISKCPRDFVRFKNSCRQQCPRLAPFTLNGTCVENCPDNTRHQMSKNDKIFCVKECQKPTPYDLGGKCQKECPDSYRYTDSECVKSCPPNASYEEFWDLQYNIPYEENRDDSWETKVIRCKNNCSSIYPFVSDFKCVSACPNNTHILNNTCTREKCPPSYFSRAVVNSYPKTNLVYCEKKCLDNTVDLDKSCVGKCPATHLLVSGHCLGIRVCPNETCYIEMTSRGRECVNKCRSGSYQFGRNCLPLCKYGEKETDENNITICSRICPPLLFLDDEKCVNSCGQDKLIQKGKCIDVWSCGSIVENGTCTGKHSCPSFSYIATNLTSVADYGSYEIKKCVSMSKYLSYFCNLVILLLFFLFLLWFIACNGRRTVHRLCQNICSGKFCRVTLDLSRNRPDRELGSSSLTEEHVGLLSEDFTDNREETTPISEALPVGSDDIQNRDDFHHHVQFHDTQTVVKVVNEQPSHSINAIC